MLPETWQLWLTAQRVALEALHPLAPWVVLSLLACVVYLPRWLAPALWARLPPGHRLDTLPAAIFGAAWAVVTTGEGDPWLAVKGAVAAIVVPLVVHYRSRLLALLQRGAGPAAVLLAAVLGQGCGTFLDPHSPEPFSRCSDQELVILEAEYRVRVRLACPDGPDGCGAYPALRTEYDDRRAEWVACRE